MINKSNSLMGLAVASVLMLNIFTFGFVSSGSLLSTESLEQNITEGFVGVILPKASAQEVCDTTCGGTEVIVKKNVDIDFKKFFLKGGTNLDDVKCNDHGGELCDYFTAEADINTPISEWKAVFNLGDKKLIVKDNKKIKVKKVHIGGSPHVDGAPSLEIISTCTLDIIPKSPGKSSGKIQVEKARNTPEGGGYLLLAFNAGITLDGKGEIKNSAHKKQGIPGPIVLNSCLDISVGNKFKIQTVGGNGGGDISLLSSGGDITINGLVRATHGKGLPPAIDVAAFEGAVTIDGTSKMKGAEGDKGVQSTSGVQIRDLALVGEGSSAFSVGEGTFVPPGEFDLFAGLIDVRAKNDVNVIGRDLIKSNKLQYSAVGINPHSLIKVNEGTTIPHSSEFGQVHITSTDGNIFGVDRAFGFFSGQNVLNEIILLAKNLIGLSVSSSSEPVLLIQGGQVKVNEGTTIIPGTGDGGLTEIRSYDGSLTIGANSQILADNISDGEVGENNLKACQTTTKTGADISPEDIDTSDDSLGGVGCVEGP